MKRAIALLALAISLTACQPRPGAPVVGAHYSPPCRIVTNEQLEEAIEFAWDVDYAPSGRAGVPARWLVTDDQGSDERVLGYAWEEDSTIYRSERCALAIR